MELSLLKDRIIANFKGDTKELELILNLVENDNAIYPFNEYELLICSLMKQGSITYEKYLEIRTEYISKNPYLWLFELSAPRVFGENFAQTYLIGKCPSLKKASKELDKNFSGEYDLWLDGIRIEVKASRAVDSESQEPLYKKAISRNTQKNFLMNFQQLKPQFCDVFIWLAVFRDEIVIWVMSAKEVQNHSLYSKGQHRGNLGNEGQMHISNNNIHLLAQYELKNNLLENAIREAFFRNLGNK